MLIMLSIWPSHVLTQVMFRLSCLLPCELLTLGNTKTNGFDEVLSSRSASGVPLLSKHCINIIYQNTSSNHLITFNGFWPGISLCSFMDKAGVAHKVFDQASCRVHLLTRPAVLTMLLIWHLIVFVCCQDWLCLCFDQASCCLRFLTRPAGLILLSTRHLVDIISWQDRLSL